MGRKVKVLAISAVLLAGSALWVLAADADRTLVYRGHLDQDGQAVTGTRALVFRFYNTAAGGTPIGSDMVFGTVPVVAGEFTVQVGPLTDQVLDADPVFMDVSVGDSPATAVTLATRQRIFPVPYAMRGRGDTEFVIERLARTLNSLTVGGALTVNGTLNVNSQMVFGQNANGSGARTISFTRDAGDESNSGKISYKGLGSDALSLVGYGPASGGARVVQIFDNLRLQGNLVMSSGATINAQANGWCDCAKTSELEDGTPVDDLYSGGDSGSAYYQCRGSRFLVGMWFNCNNALYCLEQYKCCRPCSFTGQ